MRLYMRYYFSPDGDPPLLCALRIYPDHFAHLERLQDAGFETLSATLQSAIGRISS